MKIPDINRRIRAVVDRYETGNVSAFARKTKMSQRGAAKLYHGDTTSPGFDILEAILANYPVDPSWLMTGRTAAEWAERDAAITQRARDIALAAVREFAELLEGEATASGDGENLKRIRSA